MARKIVAITLGSLLLACGTDRGDGRSGGSGESGEAVAPRNAAHAAAEGGAPTGRGPVVLCFGTSLTAGLGLDPDQAYPALIQEKVDSAGLPFRVVNAGVSGETSAAGLRRIDWLLRQPVAVLVLELGANDALRGQDLVAAKRNLQEIIDRTRARHPRVHIVVAGMEAPPNLGRRYTREFRRLFVDLARENDAALIPFLLEGVAGDPALNQSDGIHPTAAGARIVANNVWRVVAPILEASASASAP